MAITTRASTFTNRAKGQGWTMPCILATNQAGTSPAAASGFIVAAILANNIGTTFPSTIQGFPLPAGLPNELFVTNFHAQTGTSAKGHYLAYFYKMGTLDLANAAATPYDGFTHDAGWSGTLQRTVLGAANTDITLMPLLHITTATATTAPVFKLATSAGGAGYKNQAGTNVVGTISFTCPSVTTAQGSAFVLMLEDGDSAVKDITQISVTTKGTAGAATVWGVEILAAGTQAANRGNIGDFMFGGFNMTNLKPAVPSTGTVTSFLGLLYTGTVSAGSGALHIDGVLNA